MQCRRRVGVLVVFLLAAGCGSGALRDADKAIEREIAPTLGAQVERIRPGEADRTTVRSLLGEPWIESRQWGVDVYRTRATVFAPELFVVIYPFPLPLWKTASGYVLIAYDDTEVVESLDEGILLDPEKADPQGTPAGTRAANDTGPFKTQISGGGFSLNMEHGVVRLEATAERLAGVLRRAAEPDRCGIAGLAMSRPLRHAVWLDDAQLHSINYQVVRNVWANVDLHDYPEIYVSSVERGEHALTVNETARFASAQTAFRCDDGEELYATFETVPPSDANGLARDAVTLSVGTRWPESATGQRLLLYMEDEWLVEH